MHDHEHSDDDSDFSDSPDHQVEPHAQGQKKPRSGNACLTCRRMKTRCEYFDDSSPCKLCAKSNRECVKAPARRKRRKTVTRIADLEQRIQSLTSALIDKGPLDGNALTRKADSSSPASAKDRVQPTIDLTPQRPESITPDVIDKGRVDKVTGYAAFHRYREQMDQFYGFVPLPRDLDVDRYRRRKPMLFSTLVLAGINAIRPDLVPAIADDLLKALSERIHYRAERSLELVQCLLVYICYHCRSLQREHLNFYQNISTALTMALELGLGRRMAKNAKPKWIADEDLMDARRAYLGCYYMMGQAAIALRHPIFVRWGPYIEECLDVLSSNPRPAPDDVWLVDLIRLHRIAEDAHYIFAMDDPASSMSLKDPKVQYHLTALEQQLERWRKDAKSDLSTLRARLCAANVNIYIHEIALHSHQNIDSLRSPPDPEQLASFFNDMDIGPARIDSLCTCLSSAHTYFDSLLALEVNALRCLPNMYFVRSGYAAMTLKWLDEINVETMSPGSNSTSTSSSSDKPNLHTLEVKLDHYLDNMISLYEQVGKDGKSNIATAFYHCFRMIKAVKLYTVGGLPAPLPTGSTFAAPAPFAPAAPLTESNAAAAPVSTNQPQLVEPQEATQMPYANSEFDMGMPEFDTTMFDVSSMNYFDPGFTTMGFWNLGGWTALDGETDTGYMNRGG